MQIDHVTIAGPDLRKLEAAFATQGLHFEYGGAHSNGVTHMSWLGFEHGSYLELISSMRPQIRSPWWHAHIRGDAGLCAWSIVADNVADEADRIMSRGIAVQGPVHMQRQKPDGRTVEWDLAFIGEGEAGATLPFIIKDRTPRDWRVKRNTDFALGVDSVVLAVANVAEAIELFGRVYDLPAPQRQFVASLGCEVVGFPGTPVAVAAPPDEGHWLAHRLRMFGPCPCACLLAVDAVDAAGSWFGRPIRWLDVDALLGCRIALVGPAAA
jgi:hypothetical protein